MTISKIRFGGLAAALALGLTLSAATLTRGPYLQSQTPQSVTLRWRSDVATDSVVRYGASVGSLTSTASVAGSRTEHAVTVTGLSPDQQYFYSVGSTTETLAGDDANHFFATAPTTGVVKNTRIWVLGDSGTANANAASVRDGYVGYTGARGQEMIIMLGDNAYPDGTDSEYQAAVFDMYPNTLRNTVLWSTLGNHDGHTADSASESGPYYDIFDFPRNGEAGGVPSGTEAYYSFDYGNIHFVCLESYETDRSTSGAMLTWLETDLQANTLPWVVAFWHHPPYTKGSHDSDTEGRLMDMRQNALPILEQYGVDLVLGGHSHSYERSYLIDGHYGQSGTFSPAHQKDSGDGSETGDGAYQKPDVVAAIHEGAVYAVAGASGKISGGALNHPAMVVNINLLGSMVLDVNGDRLDGKYIDNIGAVVDDFTILKGADTTPPALSSVTSEGDPNAVSVLYSEAVEQTSAEATGNYAIDNGVTISGATLEADGRIVTLATSALTTGITYTLTVNNVTDLSANVIAPNSQQSFQYANIATESFQNGVSPSSSYSGTTDAYLSEDSPATNFGSSTEILADGDDPSGTGRDLVSLLRWDVSSIPAGSVVQSVSLQLDIFNATGTGYGIFSLERDWNENEATWNQASSGMSWASPGASGGSDRGSASLGTVTGGGLQSFVLNPDGVARVQQWINDPATNFGLILADSASTDGMDARSSEYGTAASRPKLTIVYEASSGDTEAPTAPTGLASTGETDTTISLSWNASTDNVGVTGYTVYRDGAAVGSPVGVSFTDAGLNPDTTYSYEVTAGDAAANESAPSNTIQATTQPAVQSTVRVDSITMSTNSNKKWRSGEALIVVVDENGAPVSGATVSGQWSGLTSDSDSGSTNTSGQLTVNSSNVPKNQSGQFIFTVNDVTAAGATFDAAGSVLEGCIQSGGGPCPPPPPPGTEIHVQSVTVTVAPQNGNRWRGEAIVVIVDANDQPVAGANVSGDWNLTGDPIGSSSGSTDGSGEASLTSSKQRGSNPDYFEFVVTGVSLAGATYAPADDVESSGSATIP